MKRKFTYFLVAMFVAFGLNAQNISSVKTTAKTPSPKADVEIHFDGENANGIGTNSEAVFEVAARFTADELAAYYGSNNISKVKFLVFMVSSQDSVTPWATAAKVKIYGNGTATEAGELLLEAPVTNLVDGWNEFVLPTPVPLVSGDYWVGYEVTAVAGFPAGCDAGPIVAGKGGWLYFGEEDGWFELSEAGLDANWNIRAVLTGATGIETEIVNSLEVFGGNGMITINNADAATAQIYNVTGQLINTVNLSNSTTVQVPAGIYIVRVGDAAQKVLVK